MSNLKKTKSDGSDEKEDVSSGPLHEDSQSLEQQEKFGEVDNSDLDLSETDEEADEGLGDGNLGRSDSDLTRK
jgi:hypothetical protein